MNCLDENSLDFCYREIELCEKTNSATILFMSIVLEWSGEWAGNIEIAATFVIEIRSLFTA